MPIETLIALTFSVLIFVQAYVVRWLVGTWVVPGVIFGIFWWLFTFLPLILAPEIPINPIAVLYILSACIAFSASALLLPIAPLVRHQSRCKPCLKINWQVIRYATIFVGVGSSISSLVALEAFNFSFLNLRLALAQTSEAISDRYSGNATGGIFSILSRIFMYMTGPLAGILAAQYEKPLFTRWFALAMMPPLFFLVLDGAKGYLPVVIVAFISGVMVRKIAARDFRVNLSKFFFQGLVAVALLFPLLIYSFLARGINIDASVSEILFTLRRSLLSYTSGHLFAFSDWFTSVYGYNSVMSYEREPLSGGFFTFMAFFQLLGDDRYVPPGIYDEYYYFGQLLSTNIYTIYRGLITDFGMFGSLVFLCVVGFAIHLTFLISLRKKRPGVYLSIFAFSVGYSYSSLLISQLVWLSTFAAYVALGAVFYVSIQVNFKPVANNV